VQKIPNPEIVGMLDGNEAMLAIMYSRKRKKRMVTK
jgi:hypothetical protein